MPDSESLLNFTDIESINSLKSFTDQEVKRGAHPARSLTFISEGDPVDLLREQELSNYSVEVGVKEDFIAVDLVRRIERKQYEGGYRLVEGRFYLFSNDEPNIYTAFSISDKEFFELGLVRYMESTPTDISRSYLSTSEIRELFDSLDSRIEGNIIIKKAVVKSPSQETEITYQNSHYFEVFEEIEEEDNYVDKVQFQIRQGRHDFEGYVSRRGEARYISGEDMIFFNYLISDIATLLSDKGDLFKNRSRTPGSREVDPLRIEYEEDSIVGVEENQRLIETLNGLTNSSMTVYHDNPYLHASILDFDDGSTVDVFLTSDREVAIVPGFRTSRRTLSRVCEQITEGFREGDVVEGKADDQRRNLDDYFA